MKKETYARAYAILRAEFCLVEPSHPRLTIKAEVGLHVKVKEIVATEETARQEVRRLNRLMTETLAELAQSAKEEGEDSVEGGCYYYQPTLLRFGEKDKYELHPLVIERMKPDE